jgi:hypothetical protein
MNKITWKCPNHGTFVGDPDENPHTEIEAEWGGTDEMSSEAQVFKAINEMAATRKCSCGEALAQQGG